MTSPETTTDSGRQRTEPPAARNLLFKALTWLLTFGCFYLVYNKLEQAGAREGVSAFQYLVDFFSAANWGLWLALMVPYSIFFFLVDSHATWRVVRWFNAPALRLRNILPIRASAYILSLVSEQVGKGAMSLYLLRRHQVPGWQAVSSMIFLGIVEICQLLLFSAVGVALYYDRVQAASTVYPLDVILPTIFIGAAIIVPLLIAFFRGAFLADLKFRQLPILHALRQAEPKHYLMTLLFKAPNMIGAVIVYTTALALFNVDVGFGEMLAFLPVIFLAAAIPLPFHAGALVLWTILFPDFPEVGAFSFVMHTFFVLFNALIGVVFLPIANRELFTEPDDAAAATSAADHP